MRDFLSVAVFALAMLAAAYALAVAAIFADRIMSQTKSDPHTAFGVLALGIGTGVAWAVLAATLQALN